ncbi:MAG: hypothetical protein QG597_4915 [Actinomycetota bacterium]|nr:hypothetical protein [Actinomycetota bacterium]
MDTPGSGDCEARVEAWGQPVLLTTSAAYVIAGIVLVLWAQGRSDVRRWELWLYAGGLALTGLGSMDYHGPALGPEPLLHDSGLALALMVALGIDLRRLGARVRPVVGALVAAAVALIAIIAVVPAASPAFAGVAGLALVLAEVVIYRRGLRTVTPALFAALGCLLVGAVVFTLSRSGGPLCQPESWLQGHGLWHVLTAAALALWGVTALPVRATAGAPAIA